MEGGYVPSATPDLQSILATLAQYTHSAPPLPADSTSNTGSPTPPVPEELFRPAPAAPATPAAEDARHQSQDPRQVRPQKRAPAASSQPTIDPATITSWQEGLRCVTKIAAANAQFAVSIKRMMKDQTANEMRWYTERQNLKHTQANRSISAAKAQSILKSLNTSFYGNSSPANEPEVDQEVELAEFDDKIYSAQMAMETAMTAELKTLGVPFFGTDRNLVLAGETMESKVSLVDTQPKWSQPVSEEQLMEMRRKMIAHLEDLYRD